MKLDSVLAKLRLSNVIVTTLKIFFSNEGTANRGWVQKLY